MGKSLALTSMIVPDKTKTSFRSRLTTGSNERQLHRKERKAGEAVTELNTANKKHEISGGKKKTS
jgi:hypothetical protein